MLTTKKAIKLLKEKIIAKRDAVWMNEKVVIGADREDYEITVDGFKLLNDKLVALLSNGEVISLKDPRFTENVLSSCISKAMQPLKPLTYWDLLSKLNQCSAEELSQNVTIIDYSDEVYGNVEFGVETEDDILDKGHIFLRLF